MSRRLRLALVGLMTLVFIIAFDLLTSSSSKIDSVQFCPISTSTKHIPTILLQPSLKLLANEGRTYWVGGEESSTSLYPLQSPNTVLRFAQAKSGGRQNTGRGRLEPAPSLDSEHGQPACPIFPYASILALSSNLFSDAAWIIQSPFIASHRRTRKLEIEWNHVWNVNYSRSSFS